MSDHPSFMSMNEVCKITSLSRSAINVRRNNGTFPKAVLVGEKKMAFVRTEVMQWVRERLSARDERESR